MDDCISGKPDMVASTAAGERSRHWTEAVRRLDRKRPVADRISLLVTTKVTSTASSAVSGHGVLSAKDSDARSGWERCEGLQALSVDVAKWFADIHFRLPGVSKRSTNGEKMSSS